MRAEVAAAFTASVLINMAGLATVDRAVLDYERSYKVQLLRQKTAERLGGTHFEFVESSPQIPLRVPFKNGRMSDRDSVSQDLTREKENTTVRDVPKIEREGPADQLEQKRFDPAKTAASAASMPSVQKPALQEQAAPPPAQEQEKPPQQNLAAEGMEQVPPRPDEMVLSPPSLKPQKEQKPAPASPAIAPSPAVQGATGRDRITTQAVSRARSHGAQVYGKTSFEATGSGMGRYMREMKEKIWLAWFPYLAFHYPKDFRSADAVISFKLDSKGQLRDVQVSKSEGSAVFAAFCVEAIQRAAPFGPLPDEILDLTGKDELDAEFVFHFW